MLTILLVDDDEGDHYLCRQIFRRSDVEIELLTAMDGLEALSVIEAHDDLIDVILLDINMPRVNGLEFLQRYSEKATAPIPVVAMLTSSDQGSDREQTMQYDFVRDYMIKPLRKENVAKLVEVVKVARGD